MMPGTAPSLPLAALLLAGLPAVAAAQVTLDLPGEVGTYRSWYGEPVDATLATLSHELGTWQGRAVRVRGNLESFDGETLRLREGPAAVLLVPVVELRDAALYSLVGRPVEVLGVARRLIERQSRVPCGGVQSAPESWCEDPELPPLPDREGHPTWPRNSITFWGIIDVTPSAAGSAPGARSALAALVADPGELDGRDVTVVGQFRGRNLFRDLPESTRRDREDWVIADGAAALWVTGKRPRGDGWRLSLDEESESRWWIEVLGRVEVAGGSVYLRAKKLSLRPGRP